MRWREAERGLYCNFAPKQAEPDCESKRKAERGRGILLDTPIRRAYKHGRAGIALRMF